MFCFFHDDVKQKEKWEEGEGGWTTVMYLSLDIVSWIENYSNEQ